MNKRDRTALRVIVVCLIVEIGSLGALRWPPSLWSQGAGGELHLIRYPFVWIGLSFLAAAVALSTLIKLHGRPDTLWLKILAGATVALGLISIHTFWTIARYLI